MNRLAKKIKGKLRHEVRKLNNRVAASRLGYSVSKSKNGFYFWDCHTMPKIIKKYDWSGILLQPQPSVFNNYLTKAYHDHPHIQLLNVALGDKVGSSDCLCILKSD